MKNSELKTNLIIIGWNLLPLGVRACCFFCSSQNHSRNSPFFTFDLSQDSITFSRPSWVNKRIENYDKMLQVKVSSCHNINIGKKLSGLVRTLENIQYNSIKLICTSIFGSNGTLSFCNFFWILAKSPWLALSLPRRVFTSCTNNFLGTDDNGVVGWTTLTFGSAIVAHCWEIPENKDHFLLKLLQKKMSCNRHWKNYVWPRQKF